MTTDQSTILVTGGLGFIGSHLVEALVKKGHRVRVLDNLSTGKRENLAGILSKSLEVQVGDVADAKTVESAVQGCDYVFHEAAIASVPKSVYDPIGTGRVNYGGTLNVLEAARKSEVQRVIFASSAAVYGDDIRLPKTESMPADPITPYGVDKRCSELIGHCYARTFGLEFVSLRYFNVFGSRQDPSSPYSGVISIFCDCFRQGLAPTIYGDGYQTRDFIHVSDVVRANLLALEHPDVSGKTLNVGRGTAISLLDISSLLSDITGQKLQPIHKQSRPGDIRHSLADISALKSLGWSPKTNIKDGLLELLQANHSLTKVC
jgi:UDP-glucose 4-epimerase